MAVDAAAPIVLETSDEDLLEHAGLLLRDHLCPSDRERLHAILVHASWSASFRPVLTSFILERLTLPLGAAESDAVREHDADDDVPPAADST
jgi:hypothetical protein